MEKYRGTSINCGDSCTNRIVQQQTIMTELHKTTQAVVRWIHEKIVVGMFGMCRSTL